MADIVNLRQARKRKLREEGLKLGEQNRVLHGRSKADRQRDAAQADTAARFIDGHRRVGRQEPDELP